jgi:hypothetical protein
MPPRADASPSKPDGMNDFISTDPAIALKQLATQLTASMLDNNNDDWDDKDTARAFNTIYQAIKSAM